MQYVRDDKDLENLTYGISTSALQQADIVIITVSCLHHNSVHMHVFPALPDVTVASGMTAFA